MFIVVFELPATSAPRSEAVPRFRVQTFFFWRKKKRKQQKLNRLATSTTCPRHFPENKIWFNFFPAKINFHFTVVPVAKGHPAERHKRTVFLKKSKMTFSEK
jgi:hypothetical protein